MINHGETLTSADITTNFGVRVGSRKKRFKPLPPVFDKLALDGKKGSMKRMNREGKSHEEITKKILGLDECPCDDCSGAPAKQPASLTRTQYVRVPPPPRTKPSEFGANHVYYFSSLRNAAGIIKWGQFPHNYATLLPDELLEEISNQEVMALRNEWHNDCCLYFGHHTPTQFKHLGFESDRDFAFIRYNADNLFNKSGARFSNGNLAKNIVKIYSAAGEPESLSELDWNIILHERKTWSENPKFKKSAELIIPHYIEPQEIDSVVVFSQEHKDLLNQWLDFLSPQFDAEYIQILQQIGKHGVQVPNSPREARPQIIVDRTLYF